MSPQIICENPARADVYLASVLGISRSAAARMFEAKNVRVNEQIIKASHKLKLGETLSYELASEEELVCDFAVDFSVQVLYEDEYLLVLNKPANVATHGCASLKEASLVEWLYENNYQLSDLAGKQRAGIIHRLDKPTSGAIIIAKTNAAAAALAELIAKRQIERIYFALCDLPFEGECERFIARAPNNRLKMRSLSKSAAQKEFGANSARYGRYSRTIFIDASWLQNRDTNDNLEDSALTPQNRSGAATPQNRGVLIAARLDTGRTHQIRSHLASCQRFIYGDALYAPQRLTKSERLMLHSFLIKFKHPFTHQELCICAWFDENMKNAINLKKEADEKYIKNYLFERFGI